MIKINKITSHTTVDFAADELKKYLRMMMPERRFGQILYNPESKDGFRLGLMQDFGLDVSDAENTELDDIVYIDCSENDGIIAGSNHRSVLIAVYEYLRQNGCRWLLPGVDGEYIPMQDIKPVTYRHAASCRYRGWCNEGAQFQQNLLQSIDLMPKLGMNVFMIQHLVPNFYTRYYLHKRNEENRPPEPISNSQKLQWKRQSEAEIEKRGIQFHDVGHGFNVFPFGLTRDDSETTITPEQKKFFAQMDGERKLNKNSVDLTNFCMSNTEARAKVADYVAEYSKNHPNVDYLHIWLADGTNNHCECEECVKKTPSDWYIILLNEIDEKLTKENIKTKIVFISYVDTTWAPLEETINNPERFALLFAPIFRSYGESVPENREKTELLPFSLNKNDFPRSLGASLDYLDEWKKTWKGSNIAFEYHFWRHQVYDLSDRMQAKLLYDDVLAYKNNDVNGIIACGTQRPFFPTGLPFYTYARTMFDNSLSYEEIEEDYFKSSFGDSWKQIREYLTKIYEALPFEYFSRDLATKTDSVYYDPKRAKKIEEIRSITKDGREIIKALENDDSRARNFAGKLLLFHADFCDLVCDWMAARAKGENELATELWNKARIETGKAEAEFEMYFDHNLYFEEYFHANNVKSGSTENIISID